MKLSKWLHMVFLSGLMLVAASARADDTDLFNNPPASNPPAPNILFILHNSANWSKASQQWVGSSTQGAAELLAIKNFVSGLKQPANIGLMMFTTTGQSGGYVRFGIRNMAVSGTALANIVSGIDVNSPAEEVSQNASSNNLTNTFYETWLYLNGSASWAGMDQNADYSGNLGYHSNRLTPAGQSLTGGFAYKGSAALSGYNTPLSDNCAKTYIIFIGNNGSNAPLGEPAVSDPAIATLSNYKYTTTPDPESAWARFLHLRPDLPLGSVAAATGSVTTYTIDAYNQQQDPTFTKKLKNIALEGGGKYFQAGSDTALQSALQNILAQIQAVNSVFASASLPVSVSVRGTYLNQVYLGVFRPDASAQPNWAGNLKQYKLGVDSSVTPPSLFLADSTGAAAENPTTGFVNPSAISYWTLPSAFWDPLYYVNSQGVGGSSDSPDGDLVEKGGAAQYIRTTFATSQSARKIYTCTGPAGSCATGSLLSSTPFDTTNGAINSTTLAASSTEVANIINWVRGGNLKLDDPNNANNTPPGSTTVVRGFAHGDVLHSRPTVIDYGPTDTADNIAVFYGSNDGMLHAVKGGQNAANGDGKELWSFIAREHFPQFQRMYSHTPTISSTNPKPYFMDGSPTAYTESSVSVVNGVTNTTVTKAYLFIPMRRGGRFIYALDVTDPSTPKFLWKKGCSGSPVTCDAGFSEMGQTWSDLRVAKLHGQANPVLIFGLGYDAAANDTIVQGTATMGRGVMVLDATNGNPIWQAGPAPTGATYNKTVSGMTYAIPATLALYDSDRDGYIDRIYATDTGANVWRINVNDANPANWTVNQLASLGGTGANARKFLFQPDIIPADSTNSFDSLLLGSGDREHPFDTYIQNRYYMIKDDHGLTATRSTPITEGTAGSTTGVDGQLYDATSDLIQVGTTAQVAAAKTALSTASGWYVALASGEKVVGGSTTLAGTVFFGTNTPTAVAANACVGNLGQARIYALNYLNAGAAIDQNKNGLFTAFDRSSTRAGGGYPPTPVAISVRIDGRTYQGAISGTQVLNAPAPPLGRRYRTYWQRLIDKN
ncbi:MAG: PilC/PilY family type IV pilus protein [Polaromonas sp.]